MYICTHTLSLSHTHRCRSFSRYFASTATPTTNSLKTATRRRQSCRRPRMPMTRCLYLVKWSLLFLDRSRLRSLFSPLPTQCIFSGVSLFFFLFLSFLTRVRTSANDKARIKKAEEALEKLDMPDLRLGRAILEACKSCAEQGNVREMMRKHGDDAPFFKLIYKMMKHEDEIVSGMGCQALANCVYDVFGRPMLLQWGAIQDFVKCLTYKDVDTQLSGMVLGLFYPLIGLFRGLFLPDIQGRGHPELSGAGHCQLCQCVYSN